MSETGRTKAQIIQGQIDSTKDELQKNIQDLAKRGQQLEVLEEKTAILQSSAGAFKQTSSNVQKNIWWKNTKMTVILTVTIIIILAAIIIPTVLKFQGKI